MIENVERAMENVGRKIWRAGVATATLAIAGLSGVAVAQPAPPVAGTPTTFLGWCQQRASLSPEAQRTVEVMLDRMETEDCDLAAAKLSAVSFLSLGKSGISDLRPLSSLTQLKTLRLFFNEISDLSPLANLTELEVLQIDLNQLSDISPLANLTNLQELNLTRNMIADLSPLSSLTELQELRVNDNQIVDVSPLGQTTKLQALFIGGNEVTDVSPLATLTQMRLLDISSNPIEAESLRSLVPLAQDALRTVFIYDTPLPADVCPPDLKQLTCFQ